jgi:hypothetical protein
MCVINGIPLGCPRFLPVHAVNCVETLKAFDAETLTADLQWVVTSVHAASDLTVTTATNTNNDRGPVAQFTVDISECKVHTIQMRVADAAGNTADVEFGLNLLGGDGQGARFRPKIALNDGIGLHTCSCQASTRVIYIIPLGSPFSYRATL